MLHCLCFSFRCRFCSEMQSCAVLYLVCRGGVLRCGAKRNECPWGTPPAVFVLCFGRGRAPPLRTIPAATVFPNQRPKAATYLCRFAAKARFDNRLPRRGFPKGRGRSPSPFGRFKGKRFLRKGGNRNPPFLKPFFGYFLSGKKVSRRRQKAKKKNTNRRERITLPPVTFPITAAPQ